MIFSLVSMAEISAEKKAMAKASFNFRSTKCKAPTSRIDLDINNVRTTILNGGDMWWDLNDAQYEIPKGGDKHSIYAGSIMIGGIDQTGNLKMGYNIMFIFMYSRTLGLFVNFIIL